MRVVSLRRSMPNTLLLSVSFLSATYLLTGCNSYTLGDLSSAAAISSPSNAVRVNQHLQLGGLALSRGLPLTFYVNGVQGGNAEFGTISSTGLYTAPAVIPAPDSVKITTTSNAYPTAPPGSVALQVWNPIPILGAVTPSGFSEGTTTVEVNGSQFIYGAQIKWNGALVQTTYISPTQLIASIDAPDPGTYPLTVTNPNPGSASANPLSLKVGPGQVVLQLQAGSGYDVRVSNQLGFGLTVNGTNHTGVTLEVNGVPGGDAKVGTAVSNTADGSITYTAPPVVPTPSNVVQLKITSVDNPKVSIEQDIQVMNPIPILSTATPTSFKPGTATIVLHGQKFITGAQLLVNGSAVPATFNSANQLTAQVDVTEPGNLDLQVLNPSPGPAASADLIETVEGTPPTPILSPEDASRFLQQATFGATDADIHHLSMVGYENWLNEQFSMPQTLQEPAVEQALILDNRSCNMATLICTAGLFVQNSQDEVLVQDSFWQQSLTANDQLRQRVKYALTQLFVVSGTNFNVQSMPRGEANYYDVLGADAFGNFRTLLEDVTLNPMMGQFLSMLQNDKGNANTDPDENYAREVMQLFTIGLWELNDDGSQKLDANGNLIPTYSNNDVMGLAKVFTGYSWGVPGDASELVWWNCCVWVGKGYGEDLRPMQPFPGHHSTDEKQFLGVTIPAGGPNPEGDLKIALDTLFNHPNAPAFFSKQMIQHMVTSNPSPAYINRVAQVFKNDGKGVRGDMKAIITAILTDPEARDSAAAASNPQYGKVRESLIRYTAWARAFTAQSRTGSYWIGDTEDPIWGLGEMSLRSPTVFNWFAPGYVPPATTIAAAGLVAPEFQMTNVSTVVGYINYMQDAIGSNSENGPDLFSSYAEEIRLAQSPDQLIDRINLLLMAGEMSPALRSQLSDAVTSIPVPPGATNAAYQAKANRVQAAIYLTMASPEYSAQF
jgi:uncharacterized protein (DUF1800 family)